MQKCLALPQLVFHLPKAANIIVIQFRSSKQQKPIVVFASLSILCGAYFDFFVIFLDVFCQRITNRTIVLQVHPVRFALSTDNRFDDESVEATKFLKCLVALLVRPIYV